MATTEEQAAKSEKKESKEKEEEEQLPCPIRYFTCITRIAAFIVIIGTAHAYIAYTHVGYLYISSNRSPRLLLEQ